MRSYAHLIGFGRPAAARAEDDTKEDDTKVNPKKEGERDAKKAKKARAAEDGDVEELEDDKTDDAADSVADPDSEDEADEPSDEPMPDAKRAKKAKRAMDDDTSDQEDEENTAARAARSRERTRCAAIFDSPHAAKNLVAAAHLAFGTSMPRSQAISVLAAMGPAAAVAPPARDTLRDRMAAAPAPVIGEDSAPVTGASATAAAIIQAGRKRRGEI